MQYSPPSFFKQGPDVWVRLVFFSLLSIALLIVDARFQTLDVVRQAVADTVAATRTHGDFIEQYARPQPVAAE